MKRGTILLVGLDPTVGQEQRGTRPCIMVSDDVATEHQRFPVIVVVPLTSTALRGPLYPAIEATSKSGLKNRSYALLDQVRAIDKSRAVKAYGSVSKAEIGAIDAGLRQLLGL